MVQVENFQEGVVVVGIGRRDLVIVKCSVPCTNSDCELVQVLAWIRSVWEHLLSLKVLSCKIRH